MLVTARATGGTIVSLPKEANRESTWQWNGRGPRSANAPSRSSDRPQQAMFVHQSCTTVPPSLADDFLRTPDLGCDAWEFAPDVSTQCEKVMTFATEQNHVSNVGLALEHDWQRPNWQHCAKRAAAFTTKGQGRNPSGTVQDGRRVLMRGGRRETKVVLQCAGEADQISVLGGFRNRTTLENGSVVLALQPRTLPGNCGGLAASDGAPPGFCEQTEAVTWLHVGLMNFSLYKPSFQILKLSAKPPAVSNLIPLRATGRFVGVRPFFASTRMDCLCFGG